MTDLDKFINAARASMTYGKVDEAAELLSCLWWAVPVGDRSSAVDKLRGATDELADRFPLAEPVSRLLDHAATAYVVGYDLFSATAMAKRMVAVWRARAQQEPSVETMSGHLQSLDTLAGVYMKAGQADGVKACLVELMEWHFTHGTPASVAWAVRELGALAFLEGDLDNAAAKFTRADELYGEDPEVAGEAEIIQERAEFHVLLGRVRSAQGESDMARNWFEVALSALSDGDAVREVQGLLDAVRLGVDLPPPKLLKIGEFGRPEFNRPDQSSSEDVSI